MSIRHARTTVIATRVAVGALAFTVFAATGSAWSHAAHAEAPAAIPAVITTVNPAGDIVVAGGSSALAGAALGGLLGAGVGCALTVPTGPLMMLTCPMGALVGAPTGALIGAAVMGSIGAGAMAGLDSR